MFSEYTVRVNAEDVIHLIVTAGGGKPRPYDGKGKGLQYLL